MYNNQQKNTQRNGKNSFNSSKNDLEATGKVPPQARELEDYVLGAILSQGHGMFERVFDIFQGQDPFYFPHNCELWEAMQKTHSKGLPVDLLTISSYCTGNSNLKEYWTHYELTKLSINVNSVAHVEAHCRIIQEKFMARRLIDTCNQAIKSAYSPEDDIFDTLQYTEDSIFDLTIGKSTSDFRSAGSIAKENMDLLINNINNPKKLTGVTSGLPSLDTVTGGWQNSDLIILGAPSGLGKTALALNFLMASAKSGVPTGFFTLEMGENQIMNRLFSIESLVKLDFIKRADLTNEGLERVAAASTFISKLPLYIDDQPALSLFDLRTKARRMKTKHNIGFIIIDYLQIMRGDNSYRGNREQEIAFISRGLKELAKSLNIPVLAMSQLNKSGEVRESAAIENDANILMILERPDYKKMEGEIAPELSNKADLKILKHRDGSLAEIALDTDLSTQRFFEPSFYLPDTRYENPASIFKNRQSNDFSSNDDDSHF